jgi:hypothetical protein
MSASQIHADGIDAKAAVRVAKAYVAEMFADESPADVGLEEIYFDTEQAQWRVTIGFTRPWDRLILNNVVAAMNPAARAYKVVTLSEDGSVLGLRNRDV